MSGEAEHGGPVVGRTWVTSQKAVNAFRDFSLDQGWVFTETPEQTDFGKDGYLDFSKGGELTGQCIALQIKGGVSFRIGGKYIIRADGRRRTLWMDSTVPVFGIVWDPDTGGLYWIDLTSTLRNGGLNARLEISSERRIDAGGLDDFLSAMWRSTTSSILGLAFGSDDPELQDAAAYDCYGLGRKDPRYLVLLRRVMFGLHPVALDTAIYILNECSLNMDLLKDPKWMSMETRAAVRNHFTWTVDEAIELLDRTQDETGFERGSFSSCIYWLIVGPKPQGKHFVELAEACALRAASLGRHHAAEWGLVLRVYWAGEDGPEVFDRLLKTEPHLGQSEVAQLVAQDLAEHGRIEL
jgi:Domain of unknown function (DUF4365)